MKAKERKEEQIISSFYFFPFFFSFGFSSWLVVFEVRSFAPFLRADCSSTYLYDLISMRSLFRQEERKKHRGRPRRSCDKLVVTNVDRLPTFFFYLSLSRFFFFPNSIFHHRRLSTTWDHALRLDFSLKIRECQPH